MPTACTNISTPGRPATGDDFEPLAPALERWFDSDKPFAALPKYVQKLIACAMGFYIPTALSPEVKQERRNRARRRKISITLLPDYVQERNALARSLSHAAFLWDRSSPGWRRSTAQQRDIEKHPGLAVEREALWKKSQEIADYERTASHLPLEKRTVSDVELQKARLRELREQEAALEAALQRKAESLGLAWPYGRSNVGTEPASPVKPPKPADNRPKPTNPAVRQWMRDRIAGWPDNKPAPSEQEDLDAITAYFAPGLSRNAFRAIREDETPPEWRKQGPRRPWGKAKKSAANPPIRGPQI